MRPTTQYQRSLSILGTIPTRSDQPQAHAYVDWSRGYESHACKFGCPSLHAQFRRSHAYHASVGRTPRVASAHPPSFLTLAGYQTPTPPPLLFTAASFMYSTLQSTLRFVSHGLKSASLSSPLPPSVGQYSESDSPSPSSSSSAYD